MAISDLERVIIRQRRALLAREATATQALLDAWGVVWDALADDLAALLAEVRAARLAGEEIGLGWLYRSARYQTLMAAIADETARYALDAGDRIAAAQRLALTAGWGDAAGLLGAQGVSLGGAFDALPVGAVEALVGTLADGSPLTSLLDTLGPEAAQGARTALLVGVATGQGPRALAQALRTATNVAPTRAVTIARTESLRAYRTASLRRYRDNADLLDGWIWSAQKGPRTCGVCLAKDGTEHSFDEPFASHPCCRCVVIPIVSDSDALDGYQTGARWFDAQGADIQREILGPRKYDLYDEGALTLADLPVTTYSPRWGAGLRERTLRELAARGAALAAD